MKKFDPETLSFEDHNKELSKTSAEYVTKTKEAMKAAADEAAKRISDAKPPSAKK